jgi:hypothetical protein
MTTLAVSAASFSQVKVMEHFIDFHRNQRAGGNHGEPLRPVLAQPQSRAFGSKDGRIDQRNDADGDELAGTQIFEHFDQLPAQPIRVRQRQMLEDIDQMIERLFAMQPERHESKDDQSNGLDPLVNGDHAQPDAMLLFDIGTGLGKAVFAGGHRDRSRACVKRESNGGRCEQAMS